MERKFIENLVEELLELNEVKLTEDQITEIVNNLMDDDYLWDTINNTVCEEIARYV
jgi:hypothetical protein